MSERISDEQLGDYVDGLLSAREAARVERHLEASAEARATVDFLRSLRAQAARLPESVEPQRDLWPAIRDRMAPAPLAPVRDEAPVALASEQRPATRAWWPRLSAPQWAGLAAAAMVLVASSSAITAWMMATPAAPASSVVAGDTPASGVSLDEAAAPAARYAVEIEQLLWALDENRESLDEETATTIETNLRVIDRAIRSAREALDEDPGNAGLTRMLDTSYRRKLELLQRAQRIIEMS